MFESVKKLFKNMGMNVPKSAEELKVEKFKEHALKEGYTFVGYFTYKDTNKLSFKKEEENIGVVISIITNDVVTTIGTNKAKRFNLSDEEVIKVLSDPKVRIDKPFKIIS